MNESALIDCDGLRRNLAAKNQVVLDATFFLPRQQRNAHDEYRRKHIPGALFFDIDQIADLDNPLPHSLPNADQFAEAIGKLGIDNNTHVIVYDNNHLFAAARVWWMFRTFGHNHVKVLDGGLVRWKQLTFPTDNHISKPSIKLFKAVYHPQLCCNLQQMKQLQQRGARQILDARSSDNFLGLRHVTDPTVPQGHIPGSINIPYAELTDDSLQTLLPNDHLRALLMQAGVNLSRPLVCSCGSGVSACVLALALYQLGIPDVAVYDGSWAEWGRQPDTPKQSAA